MKNLKKILMSFVLVALLISSAVTIAIAEASYTGRVSDANGLLDSALAAVPADGQTVAEARSEALAKVGNYLKETPVNPAESGYADLMARYNDVTFKVAYLLFEAVDNSKSDDVIAENLAKVYKHLEAAPLMPASSSADIGKTEIFVGYKCTTCDTYSDFDENAVMYGITEKTKCLGQCSAADAKFELSNKIVYADFEKELNFAGVDVLDLLVANLFSQSETFDGKNAADYYEYILAKSKSVPEKFLEQVPEVTYKAPAANGVYTGSVSVAAGKIADLGENPDFETLKLVLADTYTYLVDSPVVPTTEEYKAFLSDYLKYCDMLSAKFEQLIDADGDSVEKKINNLASFRAYLVGTPAVAGDPGQGTEDIPAVAGTQLSENVIKSFNKVREELIAEINGAAGALGSVEEITSAPIELEYNGNFEDFKSALDNTVLLGVEDAYVPYLLKDLYGNYLLAFAYDPASEGYAEYIDKYEQLCLDYVEHAFLDKIEEAMVSKKYNILASFKTFVDETPLCEAVVDKYNQARLDLRSAASVLAEKLNSDNIPTYVAPAAPVPTVTVAVLNGFLSDLETSYDKYIAAAAEDKAVALDRVMADAKNLRTYIVGSTVDTENADFVAFAAEYAELRAKISASLIATIDDSEGLASVRAYLAEAPLDFATVEAYNAKVLEFAPDNDELAVGNIYYDIYAAINEIKDSESSLADVLQAGLDIEKYIIKPFDVTDPEYAKMIAAHAEAQTIIGNAIFADLTDVIKNGTSDQILDAFDYYLSYTAEVYYFETIFGLRNAVKATADNCSAIVDKIDGNYDDIAVVDSIYIGLFAEIDAINAEDDFAVKFGLFKAFSDKMTGELHYSAFCADASYTALLEKYQTLVASIEACFIEFLDPSLSPYVIVENLNKVYGYLSDFCFSQNTVDAFNEARNNAINKNLADFADEITNNYGEAVYTVPEGFSNDFAGIITELDSALVYDAEKEYIGSSFNDAYETLAGIAGVDGPKAMDFGDADFVGVVDKFNDVAKTVSDNCKSAIEKASDLESKIASFSSFNEFITDYGFSNSMVDDYNYIRLAVLKTLKDDLVGIYAEHQKLIALVHDYMDSFKVNEKLLTEDYQVKLECLKILVDAAEYGEINYMIEQFGEYEGETALIYQNVLVDKLNQYVKTYKPGYYNHSLLASANVKLSFIRLLDMLDKDLGEISDGEKTPMIESMGTYFVENNYSSDLIGLYNSRYGTEFTAKNVTKGTTEGTLIQFAEYMSAVDNATDTEGLRDAITDAVAYLIANPISTADIYDEVTTKISAIKTALETARKAQIDKFDANATLSEYDLPVQKYLDGSAPYASTLSGNSDGKAVQTIETEENGNKYVQIALNTDGAPFLTGSSDPYFNIEKNDLGSKLVGTNGLVIDLDLMTYDSLDLVLAVRDNSDIDTSTTKNVRVNILEFEKNQLKYTFTEYSKTRDDEGFPNYQEGVHDPIYVTPGEWIHITIVLDVKEMMMELLVDYVSLGKKPIIYAISNSKSSYYGVEEGHCDATSILVKSTWCPSTMCYDNLRIYSGTSYRTLDKMETMSIDEKFKYLVEYAENTEVNAANRILAYTTAVGMKENVGSGCNAHKARLEALVVDDIRQEAHNIHIENLERYVAEIDIDAINTATASAFSIPVNAALSYLDANRLYISTEDQRYTAINEIIAEAKEKIEWLNSVNAYIDEIGRFHRATSLAALERHYTAVAEAFELCRLNRADMAAIANADPGAIEFINKMLEDSKVAAIAPNLTLTGYFTDYMPKRIEYQRNIENSKKLLDCIDFINAIVPNKDELTYDEYIAELLVKASENSEYVDPYMTVIRNIVKAENKPYDLSVKGVADAIEIFELLDEMFATALQEKHFAVIKEQLDRYPLTDSYIGKMGICAFVKNYIMNNSVDMSGPVGEQYLDTLNLYESEIKGYVKDYEAILEANTAAFLGIVKKMEAYVSYADIKPLYDIAIEKYYYSMNSDSEAVRAAIEKFNAYEAQIEEWETNGALFVGYANTLKSAKRQAHVFRALVNCADYVDKIDTGVSGVAKALEIYNQKLAEYNETVEPVNSEISEVADVVCSVRTGSIATTVLAVIKSIFN